MGRAGQPALKLARDCELRLRQGLDRLESTAARLVSPALAHGPELTPERARRVDMAMGVHTALPFMRWVDHLVSDMVRALESGAELLVATAVRPLLDGIVTAAYCVTVPNAWLRIEAAHVVRWTERADSEERWSDLQPRVHELDLPELHRAAIVCGFVPPTMPLEKFKGHLGANRAPSTIRKKAQLSADHGFPLAEEAMDRIARVEALTSDSLLHASSAIPRRYASRERPHFADLSGNLELAAATPGMLIEAIEARLGDAGAEHSRG